MIQLLKSEVYLFVQGFPGGSVVKNLPANAEDVGLNLGSKIPWKRKWQPTPVFLPGESRIVFLAWRIPWTEEPGSL